MVEVSIGVDTDEAADGEAGDGADIATVAVDVCRYDEVFWLDAGELDEFPQDIPTPPPSEQDLKNLEAVRQTIIAGFDEGTSSSEVPVDPATPPSAPGSAAPSQKPD